MSNTLKLPLALFIASLLLLLSGCMPFPGDTPELAIFVAKDGASLG
ncbi:hypothetical protein [Pseudomonas monsensis]